MQRCAHDTQNPARMGHTVVAQTKLLALSNARRSQRSPMNWGHEDLLESDSTDRNFTKNSIRTASPSPKVAPTASQTPDDQHRELCDHHAEANHIKSRSDATTDLMPLLHFGRRILIGDPSKGNVVDNAANKHGCANAEDVDSTGLHCAQSERELNGDLLRARPLSD